MTELTMEPRLMKNDAGNSTLTNAETFGEVGLCVIAGGVQPTDFFGSVHGEFDSLTSPDVLGIGDDFEMIGVDTEAVATEVVKESTFGDRAFGSFVVDTVGESATTFGLQSPVSVFVSHPLPFPASSVGMDDVLMGRRAVFVPFDPLDRLALDPSFAEVSAGSNRCGLTTTTQAKTGRVGANLSGTLIGPATRGVTGLAAEHIATADGHTTVSTSSVRIQGHSDDLLSRSDGVTPTAAPTARGFFVTNFSM